MKHTFNVVNNLNLFDATVEPSSWVHSVVVVPLKGRVPQFFAIEGSIVVGMRYLPNPYIKKTILILIY